jgi:nitrogen fixation protein NifU and related proteins
LASVNEGMVKRQIIMDHYNNPRHHHLINKKNGISVRNKSASCIDDITMEAVIEDDIIKEIGFEGQACTISTAATSIMTEQVLGKSIAEAKEIIKNYNNMVYEKEFDEAMVDEGIAFENVGKQANRIKCATIGYDTLAQIIDKYEKEKKS